MLSIYVDTDAKMSDDMLRALTRFEFRMVGRGVKTTVPAVVEEFLRVEYPELESSFRDEMMLRSPSS